jgi:serine/threonine protein kinase
MQTKKTFKQWFYEHHLALGNKELPDTVIVSGKSWQKVKIFKHDFFAATGMYKNIDGEVSVLKIFRPRSFLLLPYWLLSILEARHEEKVYLKMQDTGHVPKWIGRFGRSGIMHEYVPGCHLTRGTKVKEDFFPELEALLKTMHSRGMAYLDTNKPDNIIVGDDGKCYLIDFQITWVQPPFPLSLITYPVFAIFKDSDLYHIKKHWRKIYPGNISTEEFNKSRPLYIKIHRLFADPIRVIRRAYLRKIEEGAENKPDGSAKH